MFGQRVATGGVSVLGPNCEYLASILLRTSPRLTPCSSHVDASSATSWQCLQVEACCS